MRYIRLSTLAFSLAILNAQTGSSDPGGVLSRLTVARFAGSGAESIQAMASDAAGNVYLAGTTSSPDLPTKNATQPSIGEGLIMRTVDRGLTWQKIPNPPALPLTITPHPSEPQTLFIGAGDGVYKTVDGGQTWRHVYAWAPVPMSSLIGRCCFNIAIDPVTPRQMYVFVFGSLIQFLASSDGGESWKPRDVLLPIDGNVLLNPWELWVDPNGSGIVGLGMSRSADHGVTWTKMTPPPMWTPTFTVPDQRRPGWIYAATAAGSSGFLYLSKDWGTTWTQIRSSLAIADLLFDPDLPNTLYATDVFESLNISDDSGANWHTPPNRVFIDPTMRQAFLARQCMGGGLFAVWLDRVISSFDFGATWQPPQLFRVVDLASGPGCAVYALRSMASDAFVAKLAPGGSEVLWSTFLGGSDLDASAAIALDDQGNVYVAGNTASSDFPTTAPRSGTQGRQNIFTVKLDPDGKVIYSAVFGGEVTDAATGLAISANGEAHVVGWTNSKLFPATTGAFQMQAGTSDGFAVKLASDGTITYASYLPNFAPELSSGLGIRPPKMVSVAAEASGSALMGGYSGILYRMSPDGSSLSAVSSMPGRIYTMQTDAQGDTYVSGQTAGSYGPCFQGYTLPYLPSGDIFVTKLQPDSLQQVFSARLGGVCQSLPGALRIGPTGEVTVGLWTFDGFPMRNPVLPSSTCGLAGTAVVSRLSADGSTLLFSSYLDSCAQPPAIALAPDDSVYAGISRGNSVYQISGRAGVLRVPVAQPGGMIVEDAVNAFSGYPASAMPGMLLTITGQDLAPAFIEVGLNDPSPLPTQLGGVQVLFDTIPAEMFQVTSDRLICVVPGAIKDRDQVGVQVVSGRQRSTPFVLRTSLYGPLGLLTHSFPNLPPAGSVDGDIRNADGTVNDAQHPAAPGSTVTLFATGVYGPGDISLLWNASPPQRFELVEGYHATARHLPGFIDALYAIDLRIPDSYAPGVYLVPVPGVLTRAVIGRVGSGIGVYVK